MARETTIKVLQAVCQVAKPGEYIILSRSELAAGLPAGTERREIDSAMMELQADDYIAVRYSDGDVYCLTVQTKGFVACEKIKEREEAKKEEEKQRLKEKSFVSSSATENQVAAVLDGEIVPLTEPESGASVAPQSSAPRIGFSLRKLFWACLGGAFLGGLIAGAVVSLLIKLL